MNRILLAILALILASLACGGNAPRRLELFPSPTVLPTQTERIVVWTSTPLSTYTPIVKVVTGTPQPGYLCVTADETVHLRPSASTDGYPIKVLVNGERLLDLGGRTGNWSFVQSGEDQGWINRKYVQICE